MKICFHVIPLDRHRMDAIHLWPFWYRHIKVYMHSYGTRPWLVWMSNQMTLPDFYFLLAKLTKLSIVTGFCYNLTFSANLARSRTKLSTPFIACQTELLLNTRLIQTGKRAGLKRGENIRKPTLTSRLSRSSNGTQSIPLLPSSEK